jgi:hypothetical protein
LAFATKTLYEVLLDLLALKALYDTRTPSSPNPAPNGPFSVDAFVSCVHALIADDRAQIERLVRFPQAHDLLKKNAEHAQKLAQEGSAALETYQKQVRALEERNMELAGKVAALQGTVERLSAKKRDVETRAGSRRRRAPSCGTRTVHRACGGGCWCARGGAEAAGGAARGGARGIRLALGIFKTFIQLVRRPLLKASK